MKRATLGCLIALTAGACVHGSSLEQLHAGMSRQEVASLMGPADLSTSTPGRECAYYTILKDF